MGKIPDNREERPEALALGVGPWKQGIWCTRCKKTHSAPINGVKKIDPVALEQLYYWDGETYG